MEAICDELDGENEKYREEIRKLKAQQQGNTGNIVSSVLGLFILIQNSVFIIFIYLFKK